MLAALSPHIAWAQFVFAVAIFAAIITIVVCVWKRALEPALIAVVLTFIALGALLYT